MSRIAALRIRLGWTQPQMADYIGLTQSAVSRMEKTQRLKGSVAKLLDQLESDLLAGRVAPHSIPAVAPPASPVSAAVSGPVPAPPACGAPLPATAAQVQGFASAHGGE